jgi:polyphosphate kinase
MATKRLHRAPKIVRSAIVDARVDASGDASADDGVDLRVDAPLDAPADPPVGAPQTYINRELSALEFNQRVLAQSLDARVPLLERLKFLCISSSNLDEFFEIRVAGLKQLLELGSAQTGPDGLAIADQLAAIHQRATALVRDQYACLNEVLLPALAAAGIQVVDEADWDADTRAWVEHHFLAEVDRFRASRTRA